MQEKRKRYREDRPELHQGVLQFEPLRLCKKCGLFKPLTEYHRSNRDGLKTRCRQCLGYKGDWERTREQVRITGRKRCSKCKIIKPISKFYKNNHKASGLMTKCKFCQDQLSRKNSHRHGLKANHGLEFDRFQEMVRVQDGRCVICRRVPKKLCVDHDHETGKIRALLCHRCNNGLGMFLDDPVLMQRAIEYLRSHGT